jgi:cytochrome c oxidase cbb3-type subunit 3
MQQHSAAGRSTDRRSRSRWRAAGLVASLGASALSAAACASEKQDPWLAQGSALYDRYCALCHGQSGEGYRSDMANALSNQQFLATASDLLLRSGTARGRPGTPMSAWGISRGGPLSSAEIYAVARWIRNWQTEPSIPVESIHVEGSAERAVPQWDVRCATCHGARGQGGTYMSVSNPEFLAVAGDGFLRWAVARGRDGTAMVGYDTLLTAQNIDDLVVLMRSWRTDVDDSPFVPPSHDLGDVFINLGGPEPPWELAGRFIGVDLVKQAIDDGQEVALLDARPQSDYVQAHISGAVSVPFYDAESYLDQLPPDRWYVSYCGCPHSISGQLYDLLAARGYSRLKVLDEGFFVWQERGYPVTTGPAPY